VVGGQKSPSARLYQHRTVMIAVSDTTLAIELDVGDVDVVRRTTTYPSP
jgi:hypothetical protein